MKRLIPLTLLVSISLFSFAQNILALPQLEAVNLNNKKLQVVASTSIIADIINNIATDNIELKTLIAKGQNPHAFKLSARELSKASKANVIFVNGWDLEENLVKNLENIADKVPIVAVSANISPIDFNHDEQTNADPHVWFSIDNVIVWAKNIKQVLSSLDPDNADTYADNLENYLEQLENLKIEVAKQIEKIKPEKRILVTNHSSFGYFARDYNFKTMSIIASTSNLAEPSAKDLASLITDLNNNNICTIFNEISTSDKLAQIIALELDCNNPKVLDLHTSSLTELKDGAGDYISMFKKNVDTIILGLE